MKLNVAFVTGGLPFTGNTLEKGSLGGSETAFLQMTKAWARRGHHVHAFCNCPEPMLSDGVYFHEVEEFGTHISQVNYDILVCSRWPEFLLSQGQVGLRVFWGHDTLQDRSRFMSGFILSDLNILLSDFHIDNYREQIKEIDKFTWKSRNGLDYDLILRNIRPKVPKKVIYTSRPERGLHYLLGDILPEILRRDPEVVLHYANYDLQGLQIPEHVARQIDASRQLAKMYPKNVKPLGHLTKEQLYQEISSAQLLLYPTDFPEISPVRGDTEIETLSGRVQIQNLVGKKDFYVYSCNSQGELSASLVKGVFLTRQNTKMLKVTVKPGRGCKANQTTTLYLTPDHEVMLRDGSYIRADQLKPGNRLKAFHRYKNAWGPGYDTIGLTDGHKMPEHRFVAQYVLGEDIEGFVVDHLDRNTHNNDPKNLEVKTQSSHLSEHWKRWTLEEYKRECQKRREGVLRFQESIGKEATRELRARGGHACKGKPKTLSNHVVVSIEEAEPADAYCMEVESDHNFVANGIVVHNCITALEAMFCGTPVISTDAFALKETVENGVGGILLPGLPTDPAYVSNMVNSTIHFLNTPDDLQSLQKGARESVKRRKYSWDEIAAEWEDKFVSMMEERWATSKHNIISQLVRHEDLMMAKILARKSQMSSTVSELSAKVSDAYQNRPIPQNTAEVKTLYSEKNKVYKVITDLLASSPQMPKTMLDWYHGYAPYGLALKMSFPELHITFCDLDPQAVQNLTAIVEKMNLSGLEQAQPKAEAYDLVFIGDALQHSLDPQELLKEVSSYLKETGTLIFTVQTGAKSQTLKNSPAPTRLWNFLYSDFVDIFAEASDFKAVFIRQSPPENFDIQGTWVVFVRKLENFGKINVERRKLTTRPYQKIAACMIAKNEEANIAGAIHSIRDVVDTIYLADNSSPNNSTPKIAEDLGAKVFRVEFDNFSQVRNASIQPARGYDWILWMDADERLTHPHLLRKYTIGSVFEAFGIKQVHLTVDEMDKTYDIPNRLFRPRPHYQFNGLIHEQVEDTSKASFDTPISPSLLIPDTCLAHFGYISEGRRRAKATSRNLSLLLREARECPDRQLTKVFLLRDLVNLIKWRSEAVKELKIGSFEHRVCEAGVSLFLRYFQTQTSEYYKLAYPMYQEILLVMGRLGIPYGDRSRPPYEAMLAIGQAYGGFSPETKETLAPAAFWVVDDQDLLLKLQHDFNSLFEKSQSEMRFPTTVPHLEPIMSDEEIIKVLSTAEGLFQ